MTSPSPEDRFAIEDVLISYAEAVDARDWKALRHVFSSDAVLDYTASGGPRGPVDECVAWLERSLGRFAVSQHLIGNVRIGVTGDEATSRCAYFNPMGRDDGEGGLRMLYVGGHYDDRLRRTDDGWRIGERVQSIAWMQEGALPGRRSLK